MPDFIVTAKLAMCVVLGWDLADNATRHDVAFHNPDLTRIAKIHDVAPPYEWCPDAFPLDFTATVIASNATESKRSEITTISTTPNLDLNVDGVIDGGDFLLFAQTWASQYGKCNPTGTMVVPCEE